MGLLVILLSVVALSFGSCMATISQAPANTDIRLAEEGEYLPNVQKKKVWFALWDLCHLPIIHPRI